MLDNNILNKIKLVVFDLDGTLLDNSGNIEFEAVKLIKKLQNVGVLFSFATKRIYSSLHCYAEQLSLKAPIITLEGALIQGYPDRNIIYKSFIKAKQVKKAISMADKLLLRIALCHADCIYYSEYNSFIPQILHQHGADFKEVHSYNDYIDETIEIIVAGDQKESVTYLRNRMDVPYSFGLESTFLKSETLSSFYYLEIRKAGSNKGTAVKKLAKHLGIKIKHTAVLGDWYNDRSMFKTDAVKIAVANAVPEIRRMADYVTERTNNEGGAAEFLEMVLKAKTG